MPDLHGTATYPGLESVVSATYTCSHGVTPSAATLVVAEATDVRLMAGTGDLVFSDGTRDVTVKGCRPVAVEKTRAGDGWGYAVQLLDRRWAWQFGDVSAVYNERDQAGQIKAESRATPKQMATVLLNEMGEDGYDIDALPDDLPDEALPSVSWDHDNPAQALAALCDQLGLRVVYQPVRDRVMIAAPGDGKAFPERDATEETPAFNLPARPQALRLVGAPASFVAAVRLEAVGEDLDGSIVPIDELSYKPAAGWAKESPNGIFANAVLTDKYALRGRSKKDVQAAATKSVYRWYRVSVLPVAGEAFKVPGLEEFFAGRQVPELKEARQIVPLDRIAGAARDQDRHLYTDPARVYGSYHDGNNKAGSTGNTDLDARLNVAFTIDSARGIVAFARPMFRCNRKATDLGTLFPLTAGTAAGRVLILGDFGPAKLVLVTSVYVRDPDSRAVYHYTREKEVGGAAGVLPVRQPDVQFAAVCQYDPAKSWAPLNPESNRAECDRAADYYLANADDFGRREAETRVYPFILLADPDGARQQVTWSIGGLATTTISRNTEHTRFQPSYQYRRGLERVRYDLVRGAMAGPLSLAAQAIAAAATVAGPKT